MVANNKLERYNESKIDSDRLFSLINSAYELKTIKVEDPKLGCKHYKRKCSIKCPQCNEFFPCNICHDELKFEKAADQDNVHKINRSNITEVKCNMCQHV